jgi:hypothetical protein
MAKSTISQLSPATHRVLAAALIHERQFRKPMSAGMIRRLCEAEGASYTACLAFILGLGVQDGKLVRIGSPEHHAIDGPDEETVAALNWSEKHGDPAPG